MATTRICHSCASVEGHMPGLPSGSATGTNYQLDKFLKHTVPPSASTSVISVFSSGSKYSNYIVNTMLSGAVEFDSLGRKNIVWYAGEHTGFVHVSGTVIAPTDGIKVVLSSNAMKIHAFPTGTQELTLDRCAQCSGPLL